MVFCNKGCNNNSRNPPGLCQFSDASETRGDSSETLGVAVLGFFLKKGHELDPVVLPCFHYANHYVPKNRYKIAKNTG